MKRTWRIDGLDCANCAAKVEHAVGKIDGVAEARLDFMNSKLTVTTGQDMEPSFWHSVERKAIETEPDITMTCNETGGTASVRTLRAQGDASSVHHDDHEHDHHHDHDHHGGACGCGHVHGEDDSLECGCERKVASLGNAGHPAGCTCPLCSGEKCAVQVCVREGNTWLNADLARIVTALVMFIVGKIISGIAGDVLAIAAYLLAGYDVLWRAIKNILKGKIFDENFLMSVATIGAAIIGDYAEAAAVMIFYQTGEYFQDAAVRRSRKSISELMDIRPQTATVVRNGIASVVDPTTIQVGEIIRLLPGDRVPLDAVVTSGSSFIDTMALTGEPVPRKAEIGDELISGCVNTSAMLEAKVERRYEDSTVSRILELVEDSSGRKAPSEQFITKFARYYTPAVVVSAVLLAILPPLLGFGQFSEWVYRALVFLVISCPCALVISIPLSYFGGIGGSARKGILVKGGNYLQALAKVDTFVFDKTGTITEGVFNVQHVQLYDDGYDEQTLLAYASAAERMSNHPVAKAIVAASKAKPLDATSAEEFAGKGIKALVGSHTVLAGNLKLLSQERIPAPAPSNEIGTVVFVAIDGTLAGKIVVADKIKDSARQAISRLKRLGVVRTVMLTGDSNSNATQVAREVGIDEVHASLLPQMKVDELEKVIAAGNGTLAYVGDGINDAPVLARADIGIAMGAMGSDAAIEAADVVIMTDDLDRAADAMLIARKTNRIVMQNIVFALGVKAVVLLLGALGIAGMWMAVFADVGVAVIAIINAMRALRVRRMA
ncbi:MAG: heavy metal translocating P-type ATPase [Sphaerochaetaceae bacterium]|jgi:Cd2+/Zn2+-exporting ATPase